MSITIRQISSLDKIFKENSRGLCEVARASALKGERFSYQLEIHSEELKLVKIEMESKLQDCIRIYQERPVNCDMPTFVERDPARVDADYLTFAPCLIPDVLQPVSEQEHLLRLSREASLLWIRVDIPKSVESGEYEICICLTDFEGKTEKAVMVLEVLPFELPQNELIYTQWLYCDCIVAAHDVQVNSEEYWKLLEAYIRMAADCGINMLLTPVHNPPLDTAVGQTRLDVQLVRIEKKGEEYCFDFSLLERWITLCREHGIQYFEMPHLCTQWGAAAAPNIYVWENEDRKHMFGWHTASDSEEYVAFLKQYLPALEAELRKQGVLEHTYFHISDEPFLEHREKYGKMVQLFYSLLKQVKVIDALSHVEFYKEKLVNIPVVASDAIEPFLEEEIDERWVYYCCGEGNGTSNRFLAMSSYRNRIMGVQMYKFGMTGFLHWGYNSYIGENARYTINPYLTTSADRSFPSGDAFSVYPVHGGVLPSMRAFVFYEGLQDLALCRLLEEKTSHAYVAGLIDEVAGMDVRFASMPKDESYLFRLRERIINELTMDYRGGQP